MDKLCHFFIVTLISLPLLQSKVVNLEGVSPHLKEKILKFHQVLDTPENFTAGDDTGAAATREPRYGLAGLQEAGKSDELRPKAVVTASDLQRDIFRFSDRLSPPADSGTLYSGLQRSKDRRKRRMQREWRKFLSWRKKSRRRRSLKRRIMKMLRRKLEERLGSLSRARWAGIKRNKAFKSKRRVIQQRIRAKLREKRKRKLRRKPDKKKNKRKRKKNRRRKKRRRRQRQHRQRGGRKEKETDTKE